MKLCILVAVAISSLLAAPSGVGIVFVVAQDQQLTANYCGATWVDAVACQRPCPSGAPSDCASGETCFANTPCTSQSAPLPTPVVYNPPVQPTSFNTADYSTDTTATASSYTATTILPATSVSSLGQEIIAATTGGDGGGGGTCGNGNRGNGICLVTSECCSQYGYCGTTAGHCATPSTIATAQSDGVSSSSTGGTCGGGVVGNGICINPNECCSEYGFCGTSGEHCSNTNTASGTGTDTMTTTSDTTSQFVPQTTAIPPQQQQEEQVFGTCGNGSTGNGICTNNSDCCSSQGFCGTTLEHCTDKVGPTFPGQPVVTPSPPTLPPVSMEQQQQQQQQQPANLGFDGGQSTYSTVAATTVNNNSPTTTQQTTLNTPPSVGPHGTSKKIIGYYASWQWYDRDKLAKPSNMDFRKVQRVNFAFFQPDLLGNVYGTDRWGDPQLLFGPYSSLVEGGVQRCSYDGPAEVNCAYHEQNSGLIYQAHEQGAEVYPSIGGWTLSDSFPALSADPVSRDAFAQKVSEIVAYHDFDGVDIDWEYPGFVDHSGTPADKENFTLLLTALKYALETLTGTTGKVYGLTAALPCNPVNINNIEVDKLTTILTEFNLMSYDFFGAWDNVTGTNAPLYYQGFGDEEWNTHRCVENYIALGVPREKINIGLPFYGRSFKFASKLNQPHGGSDVANWPEDDGSPQYFNIYNKLPNMIQVRDNKSKTQYAYISHSKQANSELAQSLPEGLVSFDDERAICDKVNYAQENDLGGFIVWELSGDVLSDLRTPLLDITNKKLADQTFQCCTLHSAEECELERLAKEQEMQSQMGGFDFGRWAAEGGESSSNGCFSGRNDYVERMMISLHTVVMALAMFVFR